MPPHNWELELILLLLAYTLGCGIAICIRYIKSSNQALIDAENFRISFMESSLDAVITICRDSIIREWNEAATDIFGFSKAEAIGESLLIVIPTHLREGHLRGMQQYNETGKSSVLKKRRETLGLRKNGEVFPIEIAVSQLQHKGETFFTSRLRDIGDRKKYIEGMEVMVDELNHRVKNTLSIVQALASQSIRTTDTPEKANQVFMDRLQALSRAHDVLTRERWSGANINEIMEAASRAFKDEKVKRIYLAGVKDLRLSPAYSLSISMAIHELFTNATKYGSLSNETGKVFIDWWFEEKKLTISWIETGGPPVTPPTKKGFGSRLIRREFASDGGGVDFEYHPSGLTCVITIPCNTDEDCHEVTTEKSVPTYVLQ